MVLWRRRKKKKKEEGETGMEVISVRTMVHETLGDCGGTLASVAYVFLGYTSMVAYISKSGEILLHSFNLPTPLSGFLFTLTFTMLISVGRTIAIDQVNQWLTACMIGNFRLDKFYSLSSRSNSRIKISMSKYKKKKI